MRKEEFFCQALRMLTKIMPDTVVCTLPSCSCSASCRILPPVEKGGLAAQLCFTVRIPHINTKTRQKGLRRNRSLSKIVHQNGFLPYDTLLSSSKSSKNFFLHSIIQSYPL